MCTWGTEGQGVANHARSKDRSFGQGKTAMKTVAMVTTPTPYHLPGSMWGPVPTPGVTQVSVLEPRVRAVPLHQAASPGTIWITCRDRSLCAESKGPASISGFYQVLCSSQDSRCCFLQAIWLKLKGPLLCVSQSWPED